jgi:hypothetical protein
MKSNCVLCSDLAQISVFVWTYIEVVLVVGIACALVLV